MRRGGNSYAFILRGVLYMTSTTLARIEEFLSSDLTSFVIKPRKVAAGLKLNSTVLVLEYKYKGQTTKVKTLYLFTLLLFKTYMLNVKFKKL